MPFRSKRQQRAAFGGHIPGISKAKAKEWAAETDFDVIPERSPEEVGKPTLRSKSAAVGYRTMNRVAHLGRRLAKHRDSAQGGVGKALPDLLSDYAEDEFDKNSVYAALLELCTKLAFAVPAPGKIMSRSKHVGSFGGVSTTNFLKPPGRAASGQAINPGRSVVSAMNAFKT